MKQKKLQTVATLISGAHKAKAGAIAHAEALGLVAGSVTLIEEALNSLIQVTNAHRAATGEWSTLAQTLRDDVKKAYDLAYVVRDSLKATLGRQYSANWEGTGFSGTLKIPRAVAPLQQLLRSLNQYLTLHPTLEVAGIATASIVAGAVDAVDSALRALTVQTGTVKTLLAARRQKEKAMRMRLSGTVQELKWVIGPLDGRWEAFGFNQPGIKQRPERPEPVRVNFIGDEDVGVEWDRVPRAQHYRVWLKGIGVDAEPIPMGSPSDPDFTIKSPLLHEPGAKIGVSAVNSGGESAISDWVSLPSSMGIQKDVQT